MGIQVEGVILNCEPPLFGNLILSALDFRIVELFNPAAVDAHQMVMMVAAIDFEYRFPGFEKMPFQQPGLLELSEDAIHRRQADIHLFSNQHAIDVFRGKVPYGTVFKELKNLESRKGGLQPHVLEALRVAHRKLSVSGLGRKRR